ncbi:CDP-diacylglycerol--glycerol-3-phosphate 3-phosphatidyltransferase [Rosistilla oblonga]|uniref:CDP-diacylglycerol--glycerol-3-phosphate 3-phosphatidyltransferase n=1 Tax=Rosistilla oblonga TaxID=2527990 RepID=A0A518IZZ7_9BACT|nr:CDP-diacylglycerol--glycerol-3-phosphate 3-phosphatidyltransferase [Rosistilla oblonga]QDV13146.1 CDP-diacylglycerol--glycerol-3-phosphate 3-phosphatidyltransferase [Rosistilla oblonga]QDV58667.1 CDP-diacylglycerol--glycerol-3-phosphate 3-phosphatidyltransferase [Rosistilla oblonga]
MTTATTTTTTPPSIYNVPNLLTTIRFFLAIGVVVLLAYQEYWSALVAFSVAAGTDWMDGYWARKYGQVTKLGRIFDPFVDKIIICGTFIALVAIDDSNVAPWMAIVIVARELLVTSLRGMIEGSGGDFSARWSGKWKMVLQCAAIILVLIGLGMRDAPAWILHATTLTLWSAVALTLYSGWEYILAATRMLRDGAKS